MDKNFYKSIVHVLLNHIMMEEFLEKVAKRLLLSIRVRSDLLHFSGQKAYKTHTIGANLHLLFAF